MTGRAFSFLAGALVLAACGTAPDTPAEEAGVTEVLPPKPEKGERASAASPVAAPTGADDAVGSGQIPVALRGRWALASADCASGSGAEGALVIDAGTLRFYESRAVLATVVQRERSGIVADFAFTGEGQSWRRRIVLDAQDGGRTLIRRERGADAMPGVLRYTRCGG